MEDIFYDSWLTIGLAEHRYKEPYETIPLTKADSLQESAPMETAPGYWCRYANRLRNGNCFKDFTTAVPEQLQVRKISDSKVMALFNCGDRLLAEHRRFWALYDIASGEEAARKGWKNQSSTFFCFDSSFYAFDNTLGEFSVSGELLSKTIVAAVRDLGLHEVARVKDMTIVSGFLTDQLFPDGLPGKYRPLGTLLTITADGFTPTDKASGLRKVARANEIAFLEEYSPIPVYLDSLIAQPLLNKMALFSYDLKITRVIEGEFDPAFTSAGLNSILYVAGAKKEKPSLLALTPEGQIVFEASIPARFEEAVCPPLVSVDNTIYWVGIKGVAAFDKAGNHLWNYELPERSGKHIYPVLYNNTLTLCCDGGCLALDDNGQVIFRYLEIEGEINTGLITGGSGKYFIGTSSGLYELAVR